MPSCIPGSKNSSRRSWTPSRAKQLAASLPPEEERPLCAQWKTWIWPYKSAEGLPPLRILAGLGITWLATSPSSLQIWLFHHDVMPLYTPLGGSWLNMAESIQRIIVPQALAGQHPQSPQDIIDWLEQTVAGWNQHPTPFVWMASEGSAGSVPAYAA